MFLPGGPWLCASLTAPAALQDSLLAALADPALEAAIERAGVDRWFFVREAGPTGVPELRLRFHGRPQSLHGTVLPALHTWSGCLRDAGLVDEFTLTGYRPELRRYGGRDALEAAEQVFHRDSRLVLALLASKPAATHVEWLAAAGALHLLAVMLGSADAVGDLPEPRLSAGERRLFTRLRTPLRMQLAAEHGRPPETVTSHGRGAQRAWQSWHAALTSYRSHLLDCGQDPATIGWSLVHMHCNRLVGPDRVVERVAVALARDSALTRSTARR
ncbi:thiopeptide-type bacteriocin biosynthesis protein [Peterkaempfera sp. SMS 1(5)a]|uniref:thiopeptide-type bacteriocin biosynthesis protein n=1 Tax=Peterkaempfera podocarpi TaxID=3232308 RepID=UPI0036708743